MSREGIMAGLNDEQRRAVEAVRGPVCILAGAGSGKTTTITRRIAHQVAVGAFAPSQILAVTFTDKAAGELRARLEALGALGVQARTFHSAAFAQLRALAAEPPAQVLPSKALVLRQIGNSLPKPYRFRPAADLATEIEWAKNRRIGPDRYARALGGREPPIPVDLMERVYGEYERRKAAQGRIDFEDLLELTIRMYDDDPIACERFRKRYRAFTVDEYQDVNLLQQELLDRWLGGGDELCAVGDDYQAIYSFTGATPQHLLGLPRRFPGATVVRLEQNYRSTPEILALANRLVPGLGGAEKLLAAVRPSGTEPALRAFADHASEDAFVVERIRALLAGEGVPLEEIAILVRTNARLEDFEEALGAAGIPFRVRAGAFLRRPAARRLVPALARSSSRAVAADVRAAAEAQGLLTAVPEGLGEAESTRQADLARLVRLAEEFDDGEQTAAEFAAELERRFAQGEGRGVNLLTLHRAKGLEFEAVFLARLEERELPIRQAQSTEAIAEERRLLYVGMTRARRHLTITWGGKPSRFLLELGAQVAAEPRQRPARVRDEELPPLVRALRAWRRERARSDELPAYVIFHDATLLAIADRLPRSEEELATVAGVGPTKLERYGAEVLAVLVQARETEEAAPVPA